MIFSFNRVRKLVRKKIVFFVSGTKKSFNFVVDNYGNHSEKNRSWMWDLEYKERDLNLCSAYNNSKLKD